MNNWQTFTKYPFLIWQWNFPSYVYCFEGPSWPWSHGCCWLESWSGWDVQHYLLNLSVTSSTNETDRHDITELLLKMPLSITKQTNKQTNKQSSCNNLNNSSRGLFYYNFFFIPTVFLKNIYKCSYICKIAILFFLLITC